MIKEERLVGLMKKYLDDTYGDLTCKISPEYVVWSKNGREIASVSAHNKKRLCLSKTEFNAFMSIFGLPWVKNGDDDLPLKLISPYLKFEGGSESIPILQKLGVINELVEIALPGKWN